MLTQDDLTELKKPFVASDHEFLNGLTYLREEPITERIEQIDPAWSFTVRSIAVRDNAGQGGKDIYTVTVHAAMTIKGVTRDNVGMAVVQRTNPIDESVWNNQTRKKEPTGNQYTAEANEAEKSATTDALKRCSRLFGIGRYLLTLPKDVKDENSLARWLKAQGHPATTGNGSQSKTIEPDFTPPNASGNSQQGSGKKELTWEEQVFAATAFLYTNPKHQTNSINALLKNAVIKDTDKPVVSILAIIFHRAKADFGMDEKDCKDLLGSQVEGTVADYMKSVNGSYEAAWKVIQESQQQATLPPTGTDDIPF